MKPSELDGRLLPLTERELEYRAKYLTDGISDVCDSV